MTAGDLSAIATAVMALATLFLAFRTGSMSKATKNMVAETKAVSDATLKEAKASSNKLNILNGKSRFPRMLYV